MLQSTLITGIDAASTTMVDAPKYHCRPGGTTSWLQGGYIHLFLHAQSGLLAWRSPYTYGSGETDGAMLVAALVFSLNNEPEVRTVLESLIVTTHHDIHQFCVYACI